MNNLLKTDKYVPYSKTITIIIKGYAPANEDEEPYLPQSYIDYIKTLTENYIRMFGKNREFILMHFTVNNEAVDFP